MRHTLPGLQRWLPALALLVLSCTWGYTWVLVKQALEYASPFSLAAQRAVGGALVVAILSSRLTLGEAFKASEVAGILLIGGGLALLSLFGWLASRRSGAGG